MAITEDFLKQITDLSVRIFQQCDQNGQNEIVSPLSLIYILAAIAEGADGNTLAQIESLTGMKADELKDVVTEYQHFFTSDDCQGTNIANALVIDDRNDLHVKKSYLKSLSDSIAPQIFKGKDCVDEINQWADKETFGMIKNICDELPADLTIDLLNAIAFNEPWLDPYEDEDLYDEIFTSEDGSKEKTLMMHSLENSYFEDDSAVGFTKEYLGLNYGFLALLPNEGISLSDYIQSLTSEKLSQIINKGDYGKSVKTAIPVFTTDFKQDMGKALEEMGVTDVFDPGCADLSKMAKMKNGNIYLNGIQQTAHITVDREGTRAAAVTEGMIGFIPDFSEPKEAILNRPFLYMIVDNKHKIPVFIGTVREISKNSEARTYEGNVMEENRAIITLDENEEGFQFDFSIESALDNANFQLTQIQETIDTVDKIKPDCDKADYALAASSGALCGIFDIFLVGKPGESPTGDITDRWFAKRIEHFAKYNGWTVGEGDIKSAIGFLEKKYKIPYDQNGMGEIGKEEFGLTLKNHHFKSLGHNPTLLGLFFSLLDQFSDKKEFNVYTSHFINDGDLIYWDNRGSDFQLRGNSIPERLFYGFVNWFGHLISDTSGSSGSKGRGMGIPSPLLCWSNDIIAIKRGLNISASEFDKFFNELALNIYEKGFDVRFQSAQLIPVIVNDLIVRLMYSVRRMVTYFKSTEVEDRFLKDMWYKCEPFSNPTVKRMLTVAHGTFCLLDIADATVHGVAAGGGKIDPTEFFLRLNLTGIKRFTISLYGEARRGVNYYNAKTDARFAEREEVILEDYIDGLEKLADIYDDKSLLSFVDDLCKSDAYITAFEKTITLAEKRDVPEENILHNKNDIDSYFQP